MRLDVGKIKEIDKMIILIYFSGKFFIGSSMFHLCEHFQKAVCLIVLYIIKLNLTCWLFIPLKFDIFFFNFQESTQYADSSTESCFRIPVTFLLLYIRATAT